MLPVRSSFMPISKFFDDFLNKDLFDWESENFSPANTTLPAVNIRETHDSYVVEMAAPGMEKKDFNIELKDNTLCIKAVHKVEKELNEDEKYTRKEFAYQSFQRSFHLNHNVVEDSKIKATYDNGILKLTLPKKEAAIPKPARTIKIS